MLIFYFIYLFIYFFFEVCPWYPPFPTTLQNSKKKLKNRFYYAK